MKSKLLLERLPELSGNVAISVMADGKVFLNIIETNSSLSVSNMYDFPINNTFGLLNDYSNFFRNNSYRNINDKDVIKSKDGFIQATMLLGDKIPEYFVICEKKDGEPSKILQYYDLSDKSVIGKYLNDFKRDVVDINPITINPNRNEICISGINLVNGIISKFYMIYEDGDDINSKILTFIKENKLLLPNILNIEFQSEFSADIECYYTDSVDLFEYDISKLSEEMYVKDNNLFIKSSILKENNHIIGGDNVPMSFADDKFLLSYMKNGDEMIPLENKENGLLLNRDIKLNIGEIEEISVEKVNNPTSFSRFKYLGGIEQSEFIDINSDNYNAQLISDYMPNLLQSGIAFGATDNNYNVFNWIGDKRETMISFSKAWNSSSERFTKIMCVPDGEDIIFMNSFGGSFNINIGSAKIKKISEFKENVLEYSYFKTDDINVEKNHYLLMDKKFYKIYDVVDNLYYDYDSKKIVYDGRLIVIKGIVGVKNKVVSYMLFRNPVIGIMDVMDVVSCKRNFIVNEYNAEDLRYFLKPNIIGGTTYRVVSDDSIVIYENIEYQTGDSFIGNVDDKTITKKGIGNYCEEKYYDENEITNVFNKQTEDVFVIKEDVLFSQNLNSDFNGELPNLDKISSPEDKIFVTNFDKRTNEWLLPSKNPYIDHLYNANIISEFGENYSEELFGKYATSFEKNGSAYKTTFRGVEIISNDNLEGYKFVGIINVRDEDDYVGGIRNRIIKNEIDKYLIFVIDLPLSDYRFKENFNFCLTYNSKNSKDSSSSNHIQYDFQDFSVNGIKIKCSIIGLNEDKVVFNQKISIKTLISESNNGVSVLFKSKDNGTIFSNYGYVDSGSVVQEEVFQISLLDNYIKMDSGYMYISKINGVVFNTVMHYTELSTIIDFSDMECYQIGDFENDLEKIFSIINFSNVKENINLDKSFIEKYVIDNSGNISGNKEIDVKIYKSNSCYSGQYNIPIKTEKRYLGSTTPNIIGINDNVWNGQNHTWTDDKNSINILDKYFNKKLSVIYQ